VTFDRVDQLIFAVIPLVAPGVALQKKDGHSVDSELAKPTVAVAAAGK
jgi:hypothetical protein